VERVIEKERRKKGDNILTAIDPFEIVMTKLLFPFQEVSESKEKLPE
jgi:hypothetical protein